MEKLNLPPYPINVKELNGRKMILDTQRQRFVALTPEEWVRQHFVHYLIGHLAYPGALLANEVGLQCGEKRLRCDSVLYNSDGTARMIIEYKAPNIKITQKVFNQIAAYNLLLHVDYLIVSNGLSHYCCKMDYANKSYRFLNCIPPYSEL